MPKKPRSLLVHNGREIAELVGQLLTAVGEDVTREGLKDTPKRVYRSLATLLSGYELDPRTVVGDALFSETTDQLVILQGIEFYSLCEHHMLPFFGQAHIAYIPNGRVIGVSKIPRIIDVFARRLQLQERLTEQVADALEEILQPAGVACYFEAKHLCMMMRGTERQMSRFCTNEMRGVFRTDKDVRNEFLTLVRDFNNQDHRAK